MRLASFLKMGAVVFVGAIGLMLGHPCVAEPTGTNPTATPSQAKSAVDLRQPEFNAVISIEGGSVENLITSLGATLKRPLLVIGTRPITPSALMDLNEKPAREAMALLAREINGDWESFEDFYVLYPKSSLKGDAFPKPLTKDHPDLRAKLDGTFSGGNLTVALARIGRSSSTSLILGGGPTDKPSPEEIKRVNAVFSKSMIVTVHKAPVADVMRAITYATGDPWDHVLGAHVLCVLGKALSPKQRSEAQAAAAARQFGNSISRDQEALLRSERGLNFGQLSRNQQLYLAGKLGGTGIAAGQLLLRRDAAPAGAYDSYVTIFALKDGGLMPLLQILAP